MAGGTTIYESRARKRRRRRRSLIAAALILVVVLAAATAAVVVLLRGDASRAEPRAASEAAPSPPVSSPAARVTGLADLKVHRGETVTISYRIVTSADSRWEATLTIRDAAGRRVKARRLSVGAQGGKTTAKTPIDLPPGRYTYWVGLSAGMESPVSSGFSGEVSASAAAAEPDGDGQGGAILRVLAPLPPGFPSAAAVAEAAKWAATRDGDVAMALVDTNGKAVGGLAEHRTFQAASLAKAILLVASLRADPTPDVSTKATLTQMIEESDNDAAYAIFDRVGVKGMKAVARAARMEDYVQGDVWVDTRVSAADQARFFYALDDLVPVAGRGLARELLAGVTPMQRWGIPAAAGPDGWTTYFKGGWLGLDNKLMVQSAWLEMGKRRWALAVMSNDNPSRSYGWDTQKGVTGLLLGHEPTAAYLARVLE